MLTEKEKYECEILSIFEKQNNPIGSGTISTMLKERSFEVSEATVGRMLNELDRQGITKKKGYQGRVLTESGLDRLLELRSKKKRILHSSKLFSSLDIKDKENLVEILIARRAIEREMARLAALNASEESVSILYNICQKQAKQTALGEITTQEDKEFHRAIAAAADNKVLMAAFELIQQDEQVSPVLEYIRTKVRGVLGVEHKKIMDAIINKNPVEAEKRMVEHIESLIFDVEKYWDLVSK